LPRAGKSSLSFLSIDDKETKVSQHLIAEHLAEAVRQGGREVGDEAEKARGQVRGLAGVNPLELFFVTDNGVI